MLEPIKAPSTKGQSQGSVVVTTTTKGSKSKPEKIIRVNLQQQIVEVFEGPTRIFKFDCVTGDKGHPTDRGFFKVTIKPENYRYRSHAYNVQMNYPLFFTRDGKALHQYHGSVPLSIVRSARNSVSDWFGSHGCVRLIETDAKALYEWASVGTKVHVL
jgi:lipoprotein-anchoring transpeptidase ErfK/SrfK